MSYDYGSKHISKMTGLTGIEGKQIAKAIKDMDIGHDVIDWQTIGSDLYGHGSRLGGVKHHLRSKYGIELEPHRGMAKYYDLAELHVTPGRRKHRMSITDKGASLWSLRLFYSKRSKRKRAIDNKKRAKKRYKHTNRKGVEKWLKHPNRYDIIGIDWKPKRRKRKK